MSDEEKGLCLKNMSDIVIKEKYTETMRLKKLQKSKIKNRNELYNK